MYKDEQQFMYIHVIIITRQKLYVSRRNQHNYSIQNNSYKVRKLARPTNMAMYSSSTLIGIENANTPGVE